MIAEAGTPIRVSQIKHIGAPKIERTKQRDQEHIQELEALGWKVVVLWECQIRMNLEDILQNLVDELHRK